MKKILIWNDFPLAPVGGPSGYLYNLKKYLDEKNITEIEFLNNENYVKEEKKEKEKKFKEIRLFIKKIKNSLFKNRKLKKRIEKKFKKYEGDYSFLDKYDVIHFHDVRSFVRATDILKNFKGKTILTSHCPKTPAKEEVEDNLKMDYKTFPKELKNYLELKDQEAFLKADYLIFPCKEAQEPYEEDIDIKEILIKKEKNNKILYVPTGIPLIDVNFDSEFFLKKKIDTRNYFVISYIGRHNKVKGYDFLKKFGEKVLEKYKDVIFVIGGEINEKIPPIKNQRWIEFGWTKEGYSIIKNSDLFILPNEKTYFDLILLEVISMGTPILLSKTGGNKYFSQYIKNGFFYFEKNNLDEALVEFEKIHVLWKEKKLREKGYLNKEIYLTDFTVETFGDNYLKTYAEVK